MTASPFPLRVAAIDVGSNALRLVAAELAGPDRWVELASERVPVRLGPGAFRSGRLEEPAMDAAIAALVSFRGALDALGITRYRAVATSAVRESANGDALVRRVREEAGLRLETITADEEARLVWLAVRRRLGMGAGRWLLADLGGGSLELSLVDGDRILWTASHPLGTLRLLQAVAEADAPHELEALLSEREALLRVPAALAGSGLEGVVAIGGNAEALATLVGAPADGRGVRALPLAELRRVVQRLGSLSVAERMERLELKRDRADVILPAGLVYERIATLAGASRLVVPGVGVRDGLLLDLAGAGAD